MNTPNPSDQLTTLNLINRGLKRFLPNSQALSLAIILLVSFVFIYSLADLLMPVWRIFLKGLCVNSNI
jgi:putative permease